MNFLRNFLAFFFPGISSPANFGQFLGRNFCQKLTEYPNFQDTSDFLEYLDFHFSWEFSPASNTYLFLSMAGQPHFNTHYEDLLKQLPPSMKKDVWLRLTIRKNNPLTEEQAGGIRPDIEELLIREVNRYYKKKDRQKLKINANITPDGSNTLFRLDGFEKQLEEREALLKQKEINIKNTVDSQLGEEHKRLKDEYDDLKIRLENEYNKCFVDMKQKTYSFKHQIESQQNSHSADVERQYKARIATLDKAMTVKDKEIGKLSSTISQLKNDKKDIKKSAERKYQELENVIFAKDLKIITLNDRIISYTPSAGRDGVIEPNMYISTNESGLWARWQEEAKDNPNIRKKYTFRTRV